MLTVKQKSEDHMTDFALTKVCLVKWVEFVYICLRNKTRPTLFIGETILLTDHTHETIINHKQKGNIHMWLHCVLEYTRPFTSKAS